MMSHKWGQLLQSCASFWLVTLPMVVLAEIATDGTVGPEVTLTGPDFAITSDLGQQRGANLFHSFQVFDINTGESATFSGPDSVANIISRVTGGSPSGIDGALNSTIPGANLYLLNPAGIIFGKNATINVNGSFHASTASYLKLADGGRFDAINPGNSVLTMATPSAFGFLDSPVGIDFNDAFLEVPAGETLSITGGDITMASTILYAPEGTIGIASVASAGELAVDPVQYSTEQFSALGTIEITHEGDVFSRFVPGVGLVGNVDTSGDSGGTIVIRGGEFHVDNTLIFSDTATGSGARVDIGVTGEIRAANGSTISTDVVDSGQGGVVSVRGGTLVLESGGRLQAVSVGTGTAGTIQVEAAESVMIAGRSDPSLPLVGDQTSGLFGFVTDAGDGGKISVSTPELSIAGGGEILVDTGSGTGNGGAATVDAGHVVMTDSGLVQADTQGDGNAGTIDMSVDTLEITGGANISSKTLGSGTGGTITVTATDSINISGTGDAGPSGILSNAFSNGDGGSIHIAAGDLNVTDEAKIQAGVGISTEVPGLPVATPETNAGAIHLQVDNLSISGQAQISTQSENAGLAGDISIDAANGITISSTAGGVQSGIFSTAAGSGSGGAITITSGQLSMGGGAINVTSANSGDAGVIDITTGSMQMDGGAQISTSASGSGNAGNLNIATTGIASISGQAEDGFRTGLYSMVQGSGRGGDLRLTADSVTISNNGLITAESTGTGDAGTIDLQLAELIINGGAQVSTSTAVAGQGGNLTIQATGPVTIAGESGTGDRSGLLSSTTGSGAGGSIRLDTTKLILKDHALVTAESTGSGDAGSIHMTAVDSITLDNASITTEAVIADGGNIKVTATNLVYILDSEITTSVGEGFGDGGNINIDPEFVVLDSGSILANAFGGDGGNITIITDHFISSADSVVDASSRLGIDGTINIQSPEEDINSNLVELPVTYLDATGLLRERCSARRFTERSSLVVSGRRGLPAAPDAGFSLSGLGSAIEPSGSLSPHETAVTHIGPGVLLTGMQAGSLTSLLAARFSECSW